MLTLGLALFIGIQSDRPTLLARTHRYDNLKRHNVHTHVDNIRLHTYNRVKKQNGKYYTQF